MKKLILIAALFASVSCSKSVDKPNTAPAAVSIYQDANIFIASVVPTMASSGANTYLQLNTTVNSVSNVTKVEFISSTTNAVRSTFTPKYGLNVSWDYIVKDMPTVNNKQRYYLKIYVGSSVTESQPFDVYKP